ncbi:Hypothetical protein LUCI_1156 [Lucifera butyrica]|uniref:Peptidase MA-like domain-containing protein n=1 Tax=Lucifera butyrica TaxID=1351585 RepID=A0A498R486_9FIRM|nr:peptidase MA family metallohydrolase [Lucifera butyrica]VBB05945.1 Hypothetical protein LUCI_1156 [Lucifera butyrica]
MRNIMTTNELAAVAGLLALVLAVILVLQFPVHPQMWLYPLAREAAQAKIKYETRNMASYETAHFIIKFEPAETNMVAMVAEAAEAAYTPVTKEFNYPLKEKTLIVMYNNKAELRKAFGWSGDENAMGVYWGGVIQILSPKVWLRNPHSISEFIRTGPMVHEFTHLVFDHITNGNYPRWFTEGLAQYVEYRVNGYEWLTSKNSLKGNLYTMNELDSDFDNLGNQSLAYRESLAAVRYIADVYGEEKLQAVIHNLAAGKSMQTAIAQALGMDYSAYAKAWQDWARINMKDFGSI